MGPIQLVVFDMAGTTVDDQGVVLQSLVESAAVYHLPGTPEELNALMGMNIVTTQVSYAACIRDLSSYPKGSSATCSSATSDEPSVLRLRRLSGPTIP